MKTSDCLSVQHMDDVKLHFLCGKIASGKSTLASQLSQSPRAILISEDEWLAKLYPGEITELTHYIEKSVLIKQVLEGHIKQLINAGNTVVMDFPANTLNQRRWLKSLAESSAAPYIFHVIKVDDHECKKRLAIRNQLGENPFTTSDAEFDLITKHFTYPDESEDLVCRYYS